MSIAIGSDLILDVIKAADPARQQRAAALLGGTGVEFATADFDAALASAWPGRGLMGPPGQTATPAAEAYRGFEAVFLRTVLESMMPASDGSLYGGGTAGDMWRSLAADQFSSAIAKSGGIGIADLLVAQQGLKGPPAAAQALQSQTAWPYFLMPALGGISS